MSRLPPVIRFNTYSCLADVLEDFSEDSEEYRIAWYALKTHHYVCIRVKDE